VAAIEEGGHRRMINVEKYHNMKYQQIGMTHQRNIMAPSWHGHEHKNIKIASYGSNNIMKRKYDERNVNMADNKYINGEENERRNSKKIMKYSQPMTKMKICGKKAEERYKRHEERKTKKAM